MPAKSCIRKKQIIKKRSDFSDIIQRGDIYKSKFFIIAIRNDKNLRFGFTTKGGLKKVHRNYLKRITRELWRNNFKRFQLQGHWIIICKESTFREKYALIENDFIKLLKQIEKSLLNQSPPKIAT